MGLRVSALAWVCLVTDEESSAGFLQTLNHDSTVEESLEDHKDASQSSFLRAQNPCPPTGLTCSREALLALSNRGLMLGQFVLKLSQVWMPN